MLLIIILLVVRMLSSPSKPSVTSSVAPSNPPETPIPYPLVKPYKQATTEKEGKFFQNVSRKSYAFIKMMDDARTTKRLKVPASSAAAAAVTTRCDDESFFTDKKHHHQQNQTTDTIIDVMRKQQKLEDDFPQQQPLLSEYKLNEARTEIVLAETKRDIEMAIERIYREAMKLDHFCDGGGSGGTFGRNQSLVVGFDMEWKVL